MRKAFVPAAIALAVVAMTWMVCRYDKASRAHHDRCPAVAAHVQHRVEAPAHVSGHVTKTIGGALGGATVALVQTGGFANGDSPPLFATTDASGAWAIDNVPPGEYVASAAATEFLPANHAKVAIAAGEHHAGIDMSLEPGGSLVRGTVSDYDGKPVVGARIEVNEGTIEAAPFLALTGADGKYALSLADGEHWFFIRHDDFTPTHRSAQVDGKPQVVDFKLVRGGTIRGVVIARATGKPVPGAIVEASEPRHMYWRGAATADDNGRFVLHGAPPGVVSVDAFAAGVASQHPTRVGVGMGEQVDGVRLSLDSALSICGRIVEKGTHNGIAGASIYAASMSTSARPRALEPSSSDGSFQIVGATRGTHFLSARAESKIEAQSKQLEVGDTDVTGVIVEMEAGVTLTGRVDPPTRSSIRIVNQKRGAGKVMDTFYFATERSDTTGVWKLEHVPPGKFMVIATTTEGAVGTLPIVVADRDQKDLAVTLEKRASVSGRVIDSNGAAVAGLKIMAVPDPHTRARSTTPYQISPDATTDANGLFKLVGLEAGTYNFVSGEYADRLLATMENPDLPLPIEVAAGAALTGIVVTVEPHDGVIRGVVTAGGRPAREVWVTARLQRDDGVWPSEIGSSEPVLTDANGNFMIDHLRHRPYTIVADGPRGASQGERANVKPGDTPTIELQSLGAVIGHVKLNGRPVASYDLRCRRGTAATADPIDLHVDASDGAYALDHLPPGHYRCGASTKAGNAAGEVDVTSAAATLELTLVPWATLTGRAVNVLNGAPVAHLPAQAYSYSGADDQGAAWAFYGGEKRHETDANGRFTIDHVANGYGYVSMWDPQVIRPHGNKPYNATGARIDIGTIYVIPPLAGDPGTLGMDVQLSGEAFEVTTVSADGPAAYAGIVVGDKITAIQGHTIAELTSDMVRRLLAPGAIGAGQTLEVTLARGTTVTVTVEKL